MHERRLERGHLCHVQSESCPSQGQHRAARSQGCVEAFNDPVSAHIFTCVCRECSTHTRLGDQQRPDSLRRGGASVRDTGVHVKVKHTSRCIETHKSHGMASSLAARTCSTAPSTVPASKALAALLEGDSRDCGGPREKLSTSLSSRDTCGEGNTSENYIQAPAGKYMWRGHGLLHKCPGPLQ